MIRIPRDSAPGSYQEDLQRSIKSPLFYSCQILKSFSNHLKVNSNPYIIVDIGLT